MSLTRPLLATLGLLALPVAASAHAVGIDAKLRGGTVAVEAYYDDDSPAVAARVTVEDAAKAVVAEGRTDAEGKWSFPAPPAGKYVVRLDAGAGHVARTTLTIPPPEPPPAVGAAVEPAPVSVSVSDGSPREAFTGSVRWLMTGVGLAIITAATTAAWLLLRVRSHMTRAAVALLVAALAASPSFAHYHMLLPDKPTAKTDEEVTLTYQLGHPFEHQLFDTAAPTEVSVVAPDGTRTDLTKTVEKATADGAEGKHVTAFKLSYTPTKRGDYTFIAIAPPVKVEGEAHPLQDVAKVVVHVQAQKGWDKPVLGPTDAPLEVTPLTRPYGLTAGVAFHVDVCDPTMKDLPPVAGLLVEVERYNATPPKELPPDEQITRTARTSRSGEAVATLSEPGWWAITAVRDGDKVKRRCTLWVHIDPPAK